MPSAELAPTTFQWLADAVLVLHAAVVAFVVGGLALVWVGHGLGWRWVDGISFRLTHALAIAFVVAESWLGVVCPLTSLEQLARARAGRPTLGEGQSFIGYWLSRLLYYDAPGWVFTLAYSLFGLLVVATWWRFPPRRSRVPGAE